MMVQIDLIGYWSDSMLLENRREKPDFEEMYLAFLPNGKGFCEWVKLTHETIYTFSWSSSGDYVNIVGLKWFVYKWFIDPD